MSERKCEQVWCVRPVLNPEYRYCAPCQVKFWALRERFDLGPYMDEDEYAVWDTENELGKLTVLGEVVLTAQSSEGELLFKSASPGGIRSTAQGVRTDVAPDRAQTGASQSGGTT